MKENKYTNIQQWPEYLLAGLLWCIRVAWPLWFSGASLVRIAPLHLPLAASNYTNATWLYYHHPKQKTHATRLKQVTMAHACGKMSYDDVYVSRLMPGVAARYGRHDDVFRSFVRLFRANLAPNINGTKPLSVESCRNPFEESRYSDFVLWKSVYILKWHSWCQCNQGTMSQFSTACRCHFSYFWMSTGEKWESKMLSEWYLAWCFLWFLLIDGCSHVMVMLVFLWWWIYTRFPISWKEQFLDLSLI